MIAFNKYMQYYVNFLFNKRLHADYFIIERKDRVFVEIIKKYPFLFVTQYINDRINI